VRGFGLLQRERNFSAYEDIFNPYDQAPSVWVEPNGHWGAGTVHLVELSTYFEGLDNIVAFWEPAEKLEPMRPFHLGYTQYWTRETDRKLSANRVLATRVGADLRHPNWRQIVIDFSGPKLAALPEGTTPLAVASCSANGTITEDQVFRLPDGTWRAILKLEPKPGNVDPVDLRCTLKNGDDALTETWTYLWSPP
jgi:glucans biosynthesis protein